MVSKEILQHQCAEFKYTENGVDKEFVLSRIPDHGEIIVGREESCTLKVRDNQVSREHLAISRSGNQYFIRDLDSTNGTRLNGHIIKKDENVILQNGDIISIGSCDLTCLGIGENLRDPAQYSNIEIKINELLSKGCKIMSEYGLVLHGHYNTRVNNIYYHVEFNDRSCQALKLYYREQDKFWQIETRCIKLPSNVTVSLTHATIDKATDNYLALLRIIAPMWAPKNPPRLDSEVIFRPN